MTDEKTIDERVAAVQERIARATAAAGRQPGEVQLVAVSKRKPAEAVLTAVAAGLSLFGENRVQEAKEKIPLCPSGLTWHLIGHLQSNKVKAAVQLFEMIHSVDSEDLLQAINKACVSEGVTRQVLIQVNTAGDAAKFGVEPEELIPLLERATELINVDIMGLMTMPPFAEDPEKVRVHFAKTRELRDTARERTGFPLEELSMGMSHDMDVAIGEGATFVRVGTDIFGTRS
jgi:pyridoxal phosphate enzyme (YggS family)